MWEIGHPCGQRTRKLTAVQRASLLTWSARRKSRWCISRSVDQAGFPTNSRSRTSYQLYRRAHNTDVLWIIWGTEKNTVRTTFARTDGSSKRETANSNALSEIQTGDYKEAAALLSQLPPRPRSSEGIVANTFNSPKLDAHHHSSGIPNPPYQDSFHTSLGE